MSGISSKISKHTKKQENMIHYENNQSIDTDPEMTQMAELANENVQTVSDTFNKLSRDVDNKRKRLRLNS